MESTPNSVLIVEDDSGMVRLLRKWLEGDGFTVRSAENGLMAVQLISQELPHFLLTDWQMPYMNGLELCRWLRAQNLPRYVYTVLITVRTGQDDVIAGLAAGADSFLKKPVDRDELVMRLRSGARFLELEQQLRNLSRIEPLTGLFTRNTFLELLDKEWSRSTRHHLPLTCARLEIDRAAIIREQFGRQTAQEVVQQAAKILAANTRKCDVIAHDGAEGFLAFLPETDEPQAAAWAQRMAAAVRELVIPLDSAPLKFTLSAGIAERLHDTSTASQLLRMADEALLVAQRSGRDRVVMHQALAPRQMPQLNLSERNVSAELQGIPARLVMTPLATCFGDHEPLGKAAEHFLRLRTNSVPVVDQRGQLVGIVSEKDVLAVMLEEGWSQRPIADAMRSNVVAYAEDAPLSEIYDFLTRVTMRGVVIVNGCGQPVGMINRGSLLRYFAHLTKPAGHPTAALDAAQPEIVPPPIVPLEEPAMAST